MLFVSAALVCLLGLPDVTVRTEVRSGSGGNGAVTINILYLKGRDQRRDSIMSRPDGSPADDLLTQFTQCEQGRSVLLNLTARTYAYMPLAPRVVSSRVYMTQAPPEPDTRPVVNVVIDSVDTGERRQVGSFVARHFVTTTTVTPGPGATTTARTGKRDGWYIDVPPSDCGAYNGRYYFALASLNHQGERLKMTQHGTPVHGYAIEETDRPGGDDRDFETTTRLIDISERPIDPGLFSVPAGYRPALELPWGSLDMTRPDTWGNRAIAYWQYATGWVEHIFR